MGVGARDWPCGGGKHVLLCAPITHRFIFEEEMLHCIGFKLASLHSTDTATKNTPFRFHFKDFESLYRSRTASPTSTPFFKEMDRQKFNSQSNKRLPALLPPTQAQAICYFLHLCKKPLSPVGFKEEIPSVFFLFVTLGEGSGNSCTIS